MNERTKFCSFASDTEKRVQFENMMQNMGNRMNMPGSMLQTIGQRAFFKMEQNKNIYLSNYFTAPPMAKFKMIQELLDLFCSEIKKTGQSKKMMNRFRDFAEIQFDIFFNEKTSLFG